MLRFLSLRNNALLLFTKMMITPYWYCSPIRACGLVCFGFGSCYTTGKLLPNRWLGQHRYNAVENRPKCQRTESIKCWPKRTENTTSRSRYDCRKFDSWLQTCNGTRNRNVPKAIQTASLSETSVPSSNWLKKAFTVRFSRPATLAWICSAVIGDGGDVTMPKSSSSVTVRSW